MSCGRFDMVTIESPGDGTTVLGNVLEAGRRTAGRHPSDALNKMNPDILDIYQRVAEEVGFTDPYAGNGTLGIQDVLKAHFLIADFFYELGEGLGGVGPRSIDLLHSAVSRQVVAYGGVRKWENAFEVSATLFYGLIKDHPFYDANKRTAFLCLLYHLEKQSLCPTISKEDMENFAVDVADDKLSKYRRFKDMVKKNTEDPEVVFISDFLKRNTRKIDKKHYTITYQDLNTRLRKFGYELLNPHNNRIDVYRMDEKRKWVVFGKKEKINVRVGNIGFHGWTKQVSHRTSRKVLKITKLTYENGFDSSTFFHGADPIDCLISEYQEPLKRLANR
jgi:death-on-curing protein